MNNHRAVAPVVIVAVLAVTALGAVFFKPKWLHGDSKRADQSTQTTENLIAAQNKLSATAAASVAVIGQANAAAPDSPAKNFIAREVPVALAILQPPDPRALLEAEKRKNAVLEGKIELAEKLYGDQSKIAESLRRENAAALAAKRASDQELQRVAAERLAADRTSSRWMVVAIVCIGLYLYVKLTHLGPGAIAEMASDMKKQGVSKGIVALDNVTSRLQQRMVRFISRIKDYPNPES